MAAQNKDESKGSDDSINNTDRTYKEPNNQWSTHHINAVNSENNGNKDESKSESNKNAKDKESKFQLVTAPAGAFTEAKIRNDFIKKVYGILCIQIFITAIGALVMFVFFKDKLDMRHLEAIKDQNGLIIVYVLLFSCLLLSMGIMCVFCFFQTARRAVPLNFILLIIFTLFWTVIVGIICAQHYGKSIIFAIIITAFIVLSITALATTPYFDITNCWCAIFILWIMACIFGIISLIIVIVFNLDFRIWEIIIGVVFAFIFSLWLLYDTQLILGGKKYQLSPEEYITGAICLYIDIIQIFVNILQIMGR